MPGSPFFIQGNGFSLNDFNGGYSDHGVEMHASSVVEIDLTDAYLA